MLADPIEAGVDRAYEWVELVNTANTPVSTAGWSIGDGAAVDALPAVEVPAGGFVVVTAEAAMLPANALVVRVRDGVIGNGLNNAGDSVRLLSPQGEVVDAMSYGENRTVFAAPPKAAGAGATLGTASAAGADGRRRWGVTLRPSPGEPNEFAAPESAPTTATATARGGQDAPASSTPSTGGGGAPAGATATPTATLPTRFERGTGNQTPWIALGAAIGAGSLLSLAALRGALRGLWRRSGGRRRRGG